MLKTKRISVKGPAPKGLTIMRDEAGVPHIHAESLTDLTWGMGYCQAIDRSSQLQLMRVIGQGRLCELLEDNEDNFKIDCFFRRMNWSIEDHQQIGKLDTATREWCQALCDGINAGFAAKKWSALKLLGFQPEPWRLSDIFLMLRMTSYLTLAQSQAEVERLFIELAQSDISTEKLATLFPIAPKTLDRDLLSKIDLPERLVPPEKLWQTAAPRMMASNNWVVSAERTQSGSPIMANDPHLEVNRLPNVWYEMALDCPEYRGLGYGMPGFPGLLIGRTPNISWGATYTFMDTVDSWIEHCKDGKYRRGKRWQAFQERRELVKRKKHADEQIVFYENAHGVLEGNPAGEESYLLATAWSPAHYGAASLNANFALIQAKTVEQAMPVLGKIESAWNWVIADDSGNIGYQMSGLCPKRHPDWNGFTPAPGWDKDFDWQGFEKPEDLPRSINPKEGYIVTANQDLNALGKCDPINMPMGDYRAKRIEHALAQSDKHTIDSNRQIQMDTYSLQANEYMTILSPIIEQHFAQTEEARILRKWDLHYNEDSKGAVLFEAFYEALRKIVFGRYGFGERAFQHLDRETGLFIDFYQNFDRCLLDASSAWFEDMSQEEAFSQAFQRISVKALPTHWGAQNRFQFTNILFKGKLPNWLGFDSPEVAMIGGRATPHQGQIYQSAGRLTSFAPSVRLVADMSERVLHTRTAGGVSDNRFSAWYLSEQEGWLAGTLKVLRH